MNPTTDGLAIVSLVLSILSVVLGPLGYVPGIICGHIARARIRKNPNLGGDGLALAGLIIGYLFLVLTIVAIGIFGMFIMQPTHSPMPDFSAP